MRIITLTLCGSLWELQRLSVMELTNPILPSSIISIKLLILSKLPLQNGDFLKSLNSLGCCELNEIMHMKSLSQMPWPGDSAGWSVVLCTRSLPVPSTVRVNTLVAGLIPSRRQVLNKY